MKAPRHKYGAVRTTVDGVEFPSKAQAHDWATLRLRERAGEIANLQREVPYELVINGVKVGRITFDATYIEDSELVAHETKGYHVRDFPLRLKVFKALYPGVRVVVNDKRKKRGVRANA